VVRYQRTGQKRKVETRMSDQERGKEMVEEIILEQVLDSFPIVTERTLTDEWDGEANQV
jgi:hypothetical protein